MPPIRRTALCLLGCALLASCGGSEDPGAAADMYDTGTAGDTVAPGMVTGTTGAPGPGTAGTPGTPAATDPDTIAGGDTLAPPR